MARRHVDHWVRIRDEIYNALYRKMHREGFIGSMNLYVETVLKHLAQQSDHTLTTRSKSEPTINQGRAGQGRTGRGRGEGGPVS